MRRWRSLLVLAPLVLATLVLYSPAGVRGEENWWEIGPEPPLRYQMRIVGACYPWLVGEYHLVNLATGEVRVGTGGDSAVSLAYCGDRYFIVEGRYGVYAFSRSTGFIVDAVHYNGATSWFVGATAETIGVYAVLRLYDQPKSALVVKYIGGSSVIVELSRTPMVLTYTVIEGVPVAVYSAVENDSVLYFLEAPGAALVIPRTGSGAVLASGPRIYLETGGGVLAVSVQLVTTSLGHLALEYREEFFISLGFTVKRMHRLLSDYLLVEADTVLGSFLFLVNVDESSPRFGEIVVIGRAVPTPVGYYVPEADTTYVVAGGAVHPVPGFAVAVLGDLVFTNVLAGGTGEGEAALSFAWPVTPSVLVANEAITGVLHASGYTFRLVLPPGRYRMPRGSVVVSGNVAVVLSGPEAVYPPLKQVEEPPVLSAPSVSYVVLPFPEHYVPISVFTGVVHVASGGGRLLIVQRDRAVVYSHYGASAVIPGAWLHGGVGDCAVLYDGASFRLYDFSGAPLASYSYYLVRSPDLVTCRALSPGEYAVVVYADGYSTRITVTRTRAIVESNPGRAVEDPRGATVYHDPVARRVEYSGFLHPVPADAAELRVSGLTASWRTPAGIHVLSISDASVYVLLDPPPDVSVHPVNEELIALHYVADGRVEVVPFRAWLLENCYVDVDTDPDAEVLVDGRAVGRGPTRLYAPCFARLTVEARKPYHRPATATVNVVGPVSVKLRPEPLVARVVLRVLAPEGIAVTSVLVRVDGEVVDWRIGEVREMIARPTVFEPIGFSPDVCSGEPVEVSLTEGVNEVFLVCRLTTPVLVLTTSVPVIVMASRPGEPPFYVVRVPVDERVYLPVPIGEVELISEPDAEGYTARTIALFVAEVRAYLVDVTPYPLSRLTVRSNVPEAQIVVYDEEGNTVATGTGELSISLLPGVYTVQAMAPGYAPFATPVEVPPGEEVVVTAELRPLVITPVEPEEPQPAVRPELFLLVPAVVAAAAAGVILWRRRRAERVKVEEVSVGGEAA
ncbi:MAG: carboxypeptidase-like regulatory domain-containing protein [Thermofilaceae archaeon]